MRLPEKVIVGSLALIGLALVGMTTTEGTGLEDYPRRKAPVSGDSPPMLEPVSPADSARQAPSSQQLRAARTVLDILSRAQPQEPMSDGRAAREHAFYAKFNLSQSQEEVVRSLMAKNRAELPTAMAEGRFAQHMSEIDAKLREALGDKYAVWQAEMPVVYSRLRQQDGGTD